MKRMKIAPGFRIELVASEPMIREPVALTWDGNGRMFVVEMRGYMQDIDGTGRRSRWAGFRGSRIPTGMAEWTSTPCIWTG